MEPTTPSPCPYVFGPYHCAKVDGHGGVHLGALDGKWARPEAEHEAPRVVGSTPKGRAPVAVAEVLDAEQVPHSAGLANAITERLFTDGLIAPPPRLVAVCIRCRVSAQAIDTPWCRQCLEDTLASAVGPTTARDALEALDTLVADAGRSGVSPQPEIPVDAEFIDAAAAHSRWLRHNGYVGPASTIDRLVELLTLATGRLEPQPEITRQQIDDVLCPGCLTVIDDFGEDEDRWGTCPACGHEVDSDEAITVRQMLDGNETGPTWMDVDLPAWTRRVWALLADGATPAGPDCTKGGCNVAGPDGECTVCGFKAGPDHRDSDEQIAEVKRQLAAVAGCTCPQDADVSPELDAFYCPGCGWNGRVSGAWAMAKLDEAADDVG